MFLSNVTDRGLDQALVKTLTFQEARLRTIAENVANVGTPGYRARQLDERAFQQALRQALQERGRSGGGPLKVQSGTQVQTDESGHMTVTPSEAPVRNVLFHDGTNLSIEREMSELARTGMMHELTTDLLQTRFEGLRKAIRGQV